MNRKKIFIPTVILILITLFISTVSIVSYALETDVTEAPVSVFEFDGTSVSDLKILRFTQAQKEWLEYVTLNRKNQEIPNDDYDIVIGPVANDRTMPVISLYFSGIYDIEETIKRLMPQKLCDQYTFRTEKAIKKLKFVEVK